MSYARSWGDGFDFNDLKAALGLDGIKGTVNHIENTIGLHGFNGMGKAHGTNTLGAGLVFGGSQAIGALGGGNLMAGTGGAGGAGGAAGGGGGFMSSLGSMFGGSGSAGAPSVPGVGGTSAGGAGGMLSSFEQYAKPVSQGLQIGNQAQGLLGQQQKEVQPGQLPQYADLTGLLSANNQQMAQLEAKRMARRQQGLLGGVYG